MSHVSIPCCPSPTCRRVRLLCLELVNLASNTAVMPRGLLTGAVWAVDVDLAGGWVPSECRGVPVCGFNCKDLPCQEGRLPKHLRYFPQRRTPDC